jgi:ABC-type transport system involved in cytochrome c biogenesis ATPase subunit
MDLEKMITQLHSERERIDKAIRALEKVDLGARVHRNCHRLRAGVNRLTAGATGTAAQSEIGKGRVPLNDFRAGT